VYYQAVLIYTASIKNLYFVTHVSDFQYYVILAFSYFWSSTYCSASFHKLHFSSVTALLSQNFLCDKTTVILIR